MERKFLELEVKEVAEDGSFEGYASVFGNEDLVGDVVEPGAFKQTIRHHKGQVPILWQHHPGIPIGATEVMEEDEKGLRIKASLVLETEEGRSAYALLRRGVIKGLSIGYDIVKQKRDGAVRKLKELRLWEVSLVTFPANPAAAVTGVKTSVGYEPALSFLGWLSLVDEPNDEEKRILANVKQALSRFVEAPDDAGTPNDEGGADGSIEAEEVQSLLGDMKAWLGGGQDE